MAPARPDGRRGRQPERRQAEAGHPQDRDVVGRVEGDRVGAHLRFVAADLHGGVVLSGDHMGVGDDDAWRGHPAGALDRQAAGGPQHAHHASRGRQDAGVVSYRGGGAETPGNGPEIEGSGSRLAKTCRIGPVGGNSWLSSLRIAERWISARSCGVDVALQNNGGEDPCDRQTQGRAQQGAQCSVEQAEARAERVRDADADRRPQSRWRGSPRPGARRSNRTPGRTGRQSRAGRVEDPARVPMNEPRAKPQKESTATMKPRRNPNKASRAAKATMIQSSRVTDHVLPSRAVNTSSDQHRRLRRAAPVMALAAIAFLVGAIVGSGHGSSAGQSLSEQFASAWTKGDYATMYDDIDPAERRAHFGRSFRSRLQAGRAYGHGERA